MTQRVNASHDPFLFFPEEKKPTPPALDLARTEINTSRRPAYEAIEESTNISAHTPSHYFTKSSKSDKLVKKAKHPK